MIPSRAELAALAEGIGKTAEGFRVPGWGDDAEHTALFMAQVDLLKAQAVAYVAMLDVVRQYMTRAPRYEACGNGAVRIVCQPDQYETAGRIVTAQGTAQP